jgi:type I restriction enzyme S subunit
MKSGRDYPFVEMASVGEDFAGILRFDARPLEGSGLARFRVGDTLFAKITPCTQNGKVAFVGTLPDDVGLGSTEFIVLSPRLGTDPRFLYHRHAPTPCAVAPLREWKDPPDASAFLRKSSRSAC